MPATERQGDPATRVTGNVLHLGTDRVDITPRWPIPLAGYAVRAGMGPARSATAPLHLRTAVFARGGQAAVLISADLLWWGTDTAARVREEISARLGVPDEAILVHATHTHSGPQMSYRFVPLLGEPDAAYIGHVCTAAVDSATRALGSLVPVSLERSRASTDIGTDRRAARTGNAVPASPLDSEVTVIRCVDQRDGEVIALLVHYACHPVVHHGNAVTSDFTGAAMDLLEERHPAAVAMYLQGCCGDVNPACYQNSVYVDGGQPDVDAMGARLVLAVESALASPMQTMLPGTIRGTTWTTQLPVAEVPGQDRLRADATEPGVRGEWARLLLSHPDRCTPTVPVRLSRLQLADDLALLGMSGEPVSAFGRQVKADSGGRVLPLGYTNGMTGYLVTARQLAEGGYEPAEAPLYFGMPAPLASTAESVLRDALRTAASQR